MVYLFYYSWNLYFLSFFTDCRSPPRLKRFCGVYNIDPLSMFNFIFLVTESSKAEARECVYQFGFDTLIFTSLDENLDLSDLSGIHPGVRVFPWSEVMGRNERYSLAEGRARLGAIIYEIACFWGGCLFFIDFDQIDSFGSLNLHEIVGQIMNRGLYLHPPSLGTSQGTQEAILIEDLSPAFLEKIYWDVYQTRIEMPIYPSCIFGIHYDRIWVKKMLFELVHLSISPHIVETDTDFDFFLPFLYHKYCLDYVPKQ